MGPIGSAAPPTPRPTSSPAGLLLVASLSGEPVGCGVLRFHDLRRGVPGWAEIKRLWVASPVRGLGLGRRLLVTLEQRAALAGAPVVRLDTNRVLSEAIAMYRAGGYREIPRLEQQPIRPPLVREGPQLGTGRGLSAETAASTRSTNAPSGTDPAQA